MLEEKDIEACFPPSRDATFKDGLWTLSRQDLLNFAQAVESRVRKGKVDDINETLRREMDTWTRSDSPEEVARRLDVVQTAEIDKHIASNATPRSVHAEQLKLQNEVHKVWFRAGLLACREYMARFVAAESPAIAASIRANWWPDLGEDPGSPRQLDFNELTDGGEDGPWELKNPGTSVEALPIALQFLASQAKLSPEEYAAFGHLGVAQTHSPRGGTHAVTTTDSLGWLPPEDQFGWLPSEDGGADPEIDKQAASKDTPVSDHEVAPLQSLTSRYSDHEVAPLQSLESRYRDLLQRLGVMGHDGAVAEIEALREFYASKTKTRRLLMVSVGSDAYTPSLDELSVVATAVAAKWPAMDNATVTFPKKLEVTVREVEIHDDCSVVAYDTHHTRDEIVGACRAYMCVAADPNGTVDGAVDAFLGYMRATFALGQQGITKYVWKGDTSNADAGS